MEEKVLVEGVANPIVKFGIVKNGRGILTNKRFIFCKHGLAKVLAIGMLINLTKGEYEYDIPLSDIKSIETGKYKLGHALTITTNDGKVYKYGILKEADWKIAIANALSGSEENQGDSPQSGANSQKNFCPNCGAKLQESDKFCPNCGAKI